MRPPPRLDRMYVDLFEGERDHPPLFDVVEGGPAPGNRYWYGVLGMLTKSDDPQYAEYRGRAVPHWFDPYIRSSDPCEEIVFIYIELDPNRSVAEWRLFAEECPQPGDRWDEDVHFLKPVLYSGSASISGVRSAAEAVRRTLQNVVMTWSLRTPILSGERLGEITWDPRVETMADIVYRILDINRGFFGLEAS